jgi:threonylcarbamoyladenosine tRNA methylthiotransferase CDKAL1
MAKVSIETYGCATNKADSEAIAGLLKKRGHNICVDGDVIILNTCTVKTPTENKIKNRLRDLQNGGKTVIVAGCLPGADPDVAEQFPGYSFIGTNVQDICEAVESATAGKRFVKIGKGGCVPGAPRVRDKPVIGIIPISQGCLGNCSYCIVKNVRGRLKSFPENDVVDEVKTAVREGAKEIWLTSQDTGAWGLDIGKNLPGLLNAVSGIDGDYMVRAGMMNPNHVIGFLDELIDAYKNEKIYKFLHIPVQSGDDKVLKDMNRKYTAEEFVNVIAEFRKKIPHVTISTDVICGFPTEDEKAFQRSLDLIDEIGPDILNSTRFWSRPNTAAAALPQLHGRTTNERSRRMVAQFKRMALEKNRSWMGWKGSALVSEEGKVAGSWCARNFAYKPIIVKSKKGLTGKWIDVKILDATVNDLRGEIV